MSKVFVTGASGLLGRPLMEEVKKQGYDVMGIAYSRATNNLVKCDLTKPGEVEKLIEEFKPDFILHAAAQRFVDQVENQYEETKYLNIEVSKRLAKIAKSVGSRLIYISTDYVFDGSNAPYKETDMPNPLNKYGVTKYEGEKAVVEANQDSCILRVPIMYGPVETLKESAVTCLFPSLLDTKTSSYMSHYERRYPCHTHDIAQILCGLVKAIQKDTSLSGIFQWSGKEMLTKYDMMQIMAKTFSLPHDHIQPDPTPTAGSPRPYDAHMDNSRVENLGINFHTKFEDGIKECLLPWLEKQKQSIA